MSLNATLGKSLYWKLLQFLIVFITNILFVRLFKPELASVFYSIIYLASLLVSFFTLGMDVSLNYFLSKKQISASNVHSLTLLVVICALVITIPVCFLYFNNTPLNEFISISQKIAFSVLYVTGGLLIVFSNTIFTVNDQNYIPLKVSVLLSTLVLSLCFIFRAFYSSSEAINAFFYCYFIIYFITGIVLFLSSIKVYNKKFNIHLVFPIPISKLFQYSLIIFFINILFVLASKISIFILPYWMDANALGNYIQAYKIVEYIVTFIAFIYFPAISMVASQAEEAKGLILFLVRLSNTVILLVSIFILCFGHYLFTALFGIHFNLMYEVFIYMIPGLFALCASTFFTAYFFGANLFKYNLYSACIMLAVLLAILFILATNGSVIGAAMAFSIAAIAGFTYDAISFKQQYNYKFTNILFLKVSDMSTLKKLLRF